MASLTVAEVLEALAHSEQQGESPDTYTGEEVRLAVGWNGKRFKEEMGPLIRAGDVTVLRIRRPAIDGRMANIPGYRFNTPKRGTQ